MRDGRQSGYLCEDSTALEWMERLLAAWVEKVQLSRWWFWPTDLWVARFYCTNLLSSTQGGTSWLKVLRIHVMTTVLSFWQYSGSISGPLLAKVKVTSLHSKGIWLCIMHTTYVKQQWSYQQKVKVLRMVAVRVL